MSSGNLALVSFLFALGGFLTVGITSVLAIPIGLAAMLRSWRHGPPPGFYLALAGVGLAAVTLVIR
ncbi:MAG TPA: hypothetical protein VNF47_21970 [Streptosporangiaceae bacterium]|nr:hypothetical protein [Streptosporangiaceae bacterium]